MTHRYVMILLLDNHPQSNPLSRTRTNAANDPPSVDAPHQSNLTVFKNTEVLAVSQDPLGVQARRVASAGPQGVPVGKSGTCGTEELPQNTFLVPCRAGDPLQTWAWAANGSLGMPATGECLQLDSGQGGHCSQGWAVWTNNV